MDPPGPLSQASTRTVPKNRQRPLVTLAIWLGLLLLFAALYSVGRRSGASSPAESDGEPTALPLQRWALLIPPAAALLLSLWFWLVRRRLPAAVREGGGRELPVPSAPPRAPEPVAPPVPRTFAGQSEGRAIELRIDDEGLHWSSPARLLKPAEQLDIPWSELQTFELQRASPVWSSLGWGLVLIGAVGLFRAEPLVALAILAMGAALVALGSKLAAGELRLRTASHELVFTSRELDEGAALALQQQWHSARPELAPRGEQVTGWRAIGFLFARPYVEAALALRSDDSIRASLRPLLFSGEEIIRTAIVQRRLVAIWTAGLFGLLPLACGVAAALLWRAPADFALGYLGAWVPCAVFATRKLSLFSRWSGAPLLK